MRAAVVAIASLLVAVGSAHADPKFDWNKDCVPSVGDKGSIDYHRTPIVLWACFEGAADDVPEPFLQQECGFVADAFKFANGGTDAPPIACKLDHKRFEDHYKLEAKKPRDRDRDQQSLSSYCTSVFTMLLGHMAGGPDPMDIFKRSDAARKEFFAKVKTLTCAYDDKLANSVSFTGGNLTFYVSHADSGDIGWVDAGLQKFLPAYHKAAKEYR